MASTAPHRPIELILARQLATHLVMPIFIIDGNGVLTFYNEPAERVLGLRFDETGPMPAKQWGTAFRPTTASGEPIPVHELPLSIALKEGVPAHGNMRILGLDGASRDLAVTALPLIGQLGVQVGAMALFWETSEPGP